MPPKKKNAESMPDLLADQSQNTPPETGAPPTGELALVDPSGVALVVKTPSERAIIALDSSKTERELKRLVKSTKDIIEIKDKDGRAQVHAAAQVLLKKRTGLKAAASDLTEDAKKYTKAVNEEAARLITITQVEEDRLFALRDAYDTAAKLEEERLARIEAERKEAINTELSNIRHHGEYAQRMCRSAADTKTQFDALTAIEIGEEFFAEMYNVAIELKRDTLERIQVLLDERTNAEEAEAKRAAEAAEAQRQLEEDQANVRRAMQAQRDKAAREEAERVRVADIRAKITAMQMKPMSFLGKPAADIQAGVDELTAFAPDESFAEFAAEAISVAAQGVTMLTAMHAQQVMVEQAAAVVAEQARQKAAAEAEEARKAAEAKADQDRIDAEALAAQQQADADAAALLVVDAHEPEVIEEEPEVAEVVTTPVITEPMPVEALELAPVMAEVTTAEPEASNDDVADAVPYTIAESEFIEAVQRMLATHGIHQIQHLVDYALGLTEEAA